MPAALHASVFAALAALIAAEGLRDDPSRDGTRLVRVSNVTLGAFAAATGGYLGGHFDRDDFESIGSDHLIIWATPAHLELMRIAGFAGRPEQDVGAINLAAEKKRDYRDAAGKVRLTLSTQLGWPESRDLARFD